MVSIRPKIHVKKIIGSETFSRSLLRWGRRQSMKCKQDSATTEYISGNMYNVHRGDHNSTREVFTVWRSGWYWSVDSHVPRWPTYGHICAVICEEDATICHRRLSSILEVSIPYFILALVHSVIFKNKTNLTLKSKLFFFLVFLACALLHYISQKE